MFLLAHIRCVFHQYISDVSVFCVFISGASEFSQDDALSLQRLTTVPQSGGPVADAQVCP